MSREKLYIMRDEALKNGLIDMINFIKPNSPTDMMSMIEIGSYAGESTIIFAQHFNQVLSIDPFLNDYDMNDTTCHHMELDKVYEIFKTNTIEHKNISHIREKSDDAYVNLPDNFYDFVYIDGLHTYEQVKKDILNYLPKIKKGGFIGGHDYHPNWQGVVDAINELLVVERVFSDTSWIVQGK
jgi:predicted O-methyltransferase YrrM